MDAVILTGGSRGLGAALLDALVASGRDVAVLARTPPATPCRFIRTDLSDPAGARAGIAQALDTFAHADRLTLINNAGTVAPITLSGQYPAGEAEQALTLNLVTPILLCNAAIAAAAGRPLRILNISSGAAVSVYPGWGVYGAGKAGLDHFTRHVAAEHPGIRAVSLYPGVIDTGMQADIRATREQDFPNRARFDALARDGALSAPADAARRILAWLDHPDFGREPVVDIRHLQAD